MNVLLVYPKTANAFNVLEGDRIAPGLLYLASATRAAGHNVQIVISDSQHIMKYVQNFAPDIVGVSSNTATYQEAADIVRVVKIFSPEMKTVMGGAHVTFEPVTAIEETGTEYVVRGEGETSFPMLLDACQNRIELGEVPGLCYREGSNIVVKEIAYVENLDTIPYPSADLIPRNAVHKPFVYSSRGCPHRCSYCTIPAFYDGKYRVRAINIVLDEIMSLCDAGFSHFLFLDDNFTSDTRRVEALCDGMIEMGIKIRWGCQARTDRIAENPNLVSKMAKAGCTSMTIGIESGIDQILDSYNKKITLDQVHEAIRIMDSSNIVDFWYYMFGSADSYDTIDFWEANAEFLFDIDRDLVNISIFTPYPGTAVFNQLRAEGRIIEHEWSKWDATHCVYQPEGADARQLEQIYYDTIKKHYLSRPLIRSIRAILHGSSCGRFEISGLISLLLYTAWEGRRRRRALSKAS